MPHAIQKFPLSSLDILLLCTCLVTLMACFAACAQDQRPTPTIRVSENVLISKDDSAIPHVEPHLAINPRNPDNLVIAVATFPVPDETHIMRVYSSLDGAQTWSSININETSGGGIDPWVAFDSKGIAYLVSIPPTRVRRSRDGGRIWSEPIRLPRGDGRDFDYPKIVVDRTGGNFDGRIYVVAAQGVKRSERPHGRPISVVRSLDSGITFLPPVRIHPNNINNQNGTAVVLPSGSLLVSFHEIDIHNEFMSNPRMWVSRSDDGGETFSVPYLVAEGFRADSPHLAVDRTDGPNSGRVYAAWLGLNQDFHCYVAYSDDSGQKWSTPIRINDGPAPKPTHHPTVVVSDSGVVGLAWQDARHEAGNSCYAYYFTASLDGGATFLPNVQVSSEVACSDTPGNDHKYSSTAPTIGHRWPDGGDYQGLVALPDGRFYAAWIDARTGLFQLWGARIELVRP